MKIYCYTILGGGDDRWNIHSNTEINTAWK